MSNKVTITTLKAPWPEGAKVGDVIQFKGDVPAWAAGKFKPAAEDAKVDHKYVPAEASTADPEASFVEFREQAEEAFTSLKSQHAAEVADLRAQIDAGGQSLQLVLDEVADLKAKLAAAETEDGQAAAAVKLAEQQAADEKAAHAASGKAKK